jgi:hypothetical protein
VPEEEKATEEVVDEATAAAAGTRKAALWIAAALGGIPSLAILGALVRAPGDAGFNGYLLGVGIGLAAIGAVVGVFSIADVIEPVAVTDAMLLERPFDVTRVPGHPFKTYSDLLERLRHNRGQLWNRVYLASDATVWAKKAAAKGASSEMLLKEAEQDLANYQPDDDKKKRLKKTVEDAKRTRDRDRATADSYSAEAAALDESVTLMKKQVQAAETVRSDAFRLYASDEVRRHYGATRSTVAAAALLVAAGILSLALAPKAPSEEATPPTLVSLTLNPAGQKTLECDSVSIQGIRIGGEDDAPLVITFPTSGCPARLVTFTTTPSAGLGTVEEEETIKAVPGPSAAGT